MTTKATPAPVSQTQKALDQLDTLTKGFQELKVEIEELKKPVYKSGNPNRVFHATSGPIGRDSEGYSILKAVAFSLGYMSREDCKEELETHRRLKSIYSKAGFQPHYGAQGLMVPFSTSHIPQYEEEGRKLAGELREKMAATVVRTDPDEMRWINKQVGGAYTKALGSISDAAGGVLVGFPTLGELIDLQRNMEAFPKAGASEVTLPPNGRIQFPKLTGGSTAYWIPESLPITDSTQSTGYLDLQAKKLGILVKLNNELLRFNTISAEAMVRMDMARVAALKADLAMLEGTGGTQIKGLLTYDTTTAWTTGVDKLIVHTASVVGSNGDQFQPEDVALMEGKLPDAVDAPSSWMMRKNFFSVIMNRRADAVTANDGKGPFVFWTARGSAADMPPLELYGTPVTRSSQISNTRTKGSGSNLTYVLMGYFPDWIIARAGVLEFLASNLGDTPLQNDQTFLRGLQYIDAGPRHAASFVMCDSLLVA